MKVMIGAKRESWAQRELRKRPSVVVVAKSNVFVKCVQ